MRRLGVSLFAALLTLQAAEYVHFKNGVKIEIDRHEQEGSNVWLYTKDGFLLKDLEEISKFEQILPPGAKPPAPPMAARTPSRPLPGVDINSKAYKLIESSAAKHGIPPELVHAVASVESAYQQNARSPKGAIGVMQLMPETARYLGANPKDEAQNIDAGIRFLRELLIKYQNDPDQIALALAAYNAGPNAVDRYHGVPPYRETKAYVEKVIQRYIAQGKE